MSILNGLRLLGDLGMYYAFAGYFLWCFGTRAEIGCLLAPAVCFGLSARLSAWLAAHPPRRAQAGRWLRAAVLLPALLCFGPGGTAERIAFAPAFGYALYLALAGDYQLSHYRCADHFTWFIRAYPPFALLFAVWNAQGVLRGSLPLALMALMAEVCLLRVLRHDAEIFRQPGFLLRNVLLPAALAGLAWLLSAEWVTDAAARLAGALYFGFFEPALEKLTWLLAQAGEAILYPLLQLYIRLLAWLETLGRGNDSGADSIFGSTGDRLAEQAGRPDPAAQGLVYTIAGAAAALAAFVAVVLLFRFLAKKAAEEGAAADEPGWLAAASSPDGPPEKDEKPARGAAEQVRRAYRRYLRACAASGRQVRPWDTSRDVLAAAPPELRAAETELRALYIKARYQGSARAADAARAQELCREIRRELKRLSSPERDPAGPRAKGRRLWRNTDGSLRSHDRL